MVKSIMMMFLTIASAFGFDWNTKEIEGVKYVELDQVGQFYKLKKGDTGDAEVIFKESAVTIQFEVGSRSAVFNEVHFELIHSVRENDGKNWLSVRDVKECVDSVLRPSEAKNRVKFVKVILDPRMDLAEPKFVALLNGVREEVEKRDFEVEVLWKEGEAMTDAEKLKRITASEDAIYLEFKVGLGEANSLRTVAFGEGTELRGQSVGLATALHWTVLRGQKRSDFKMADRSISLSDKPSLVGMMVPACRLELTLLKGSGELAVDEITKAVPEGLIFARKATNREPKK